MNLLKRVLKAIKESFFPTYSPWNEFDFTAWNLEIEDYDLNYRQFRALIQDQQCEGLIYIDNKGNIFLYQNIINGFSYCNHSDYKYAYHLCKVKELNRNVLALHRIQHFEIHN